MPSELHLTGVSERRISEKMQIDKSGFTTHRCTHSEPCHLNTGSWVHERRWAAEMPNLLRIRLWDVTLFGWASVSRRFEKHSAFIFKRREVFSDFFLTGKGKGKGKGKGTVFFCKVRRYQTSESASLPTRTEFPCLPYSGVWKFQFLVIQHAVLVIRKSVY